MADLTDVGRLLRELLGAFSLVFLVTESSAMGDRGLGLRTFLRGAGLGKLAGCPYCFGFWASVASRLALADGAAALALAVGGAVAALVGTVVALLVVGRGSSWRVLSGAALFGAFAVPAVTGIPALSGLDLERVPGEVVRALGGAGFCYAVREFVEGSLARAVLGAAALAAMLVLGVLLGA